MATAIKVVDLHKVYVVGKERVVALAGINLEIEQGEICSIVGPSGSGKSTLLNMLAGLEKPSKGKVFIGKNSISTMSEKDLAKFRQKYLGFIFQSYNLLQQLTAVENVAFPLMFKGVKKPVREKEAATLLNVVGLGERLHHRPTEMSGGQQQRVGIARAFMGKPKVVFADEPTGNLDTKTAKIVMDTIIQHARDNNITLVMVTHDNDIAKFSDRVISIRDGEILSDTGHEVIKSAKPTKHANLPVSNKGGNADMTEAGENMAELDEKPPQGAQAPAQQNVQTPQGAQVSAQQEEGAKPKLETTGTDDALLDAQEKEQLINSIIEAKKQSKENNNKTEVD